MIISIWRYSHLALAVSSSLFVLILAITGTILSFDPISANLTAGSAVQDYSETSIAQTVEVLRLTYPEVLSVQVDVNGLISASVITDEGEMADFYIDPTTGEKTGDIIEQSSFIKSVTNIHRSLLLKSPGRIFVGVNSFLLLVIALTGLVLIVKRQQGIRHFFSRIINENFQQFSHVYLGRLAFIPIVVITLSGVYLSLLRFSVIPSPIIEHEIDYDNISATPQIPLTEFTIFTQHNITELRSIEFPFSEDPIDYYQLNLKEKEVIVNQYTGELLSEIHYPLVVLFSDWSTMIHTGQGTIWWALLLGISSLTIPYFMITGFKMTLKRRSSKIKNSYTKEECDHIILVGSETGTTLQFATLFHEQLQSAGIKSYITQLNRFEAFPNMKQLVVFTATYGQGEAPANANNFEQLVQSTRLKQEVQFSVVGFGSLSYPDFCKYAFDVDHLLTETPKATRLLPPHTINNRSWEAFRQWINDWNTAHDLDLSIPQQEITESKRVINSFKLKSKQTYVDTFTLELETKNGKRIQSGDLLSIDPKDGTHERLYSIGKLSDNRIFLSVKLHEHGVCSNLLNNLEIDELIDGHIVANKHFQFPKKAKQVLMISTGTGIAPFVGMLQENHRKAETLLYWGSKTSHNFSLYEQYIAQNLDSGKLSSFQTAYSREEGHPKTYVQELLKRDSDIVAQLLNNKGVIMICGSLAMQTGVTEELNRITTQYLSKPLSSFQKKGQVKMDCY
jgi:sulfite reductase (NADPH) flavoprotein alpha-component